MKRLTLFLTLILTLALAGTGWASISQHGSTYGAGSSPINSIAVSQNDVIIVTVESQLGIAAPSDGTNTYHSIDSVSGVFGQYSCYVQMFYAIASVNNNSLSLSWTAGGQTVVQVSVYSGVNTTTPIDNYGHHADTQAANDHPYSGDSWTVSMSNNLTGGMLVGCWGNRGYSMTGSGTGGWTSIGYTSGYGLNTLSMGYSISGSYAPLFNSTTSMVAGGIIVGLNPTITAPVFTSSSITANSQTTASATATLTNNGGATITDEGFVWNTTGSPTLLNSTKVAIAGGSIVQSGAFSTTITGLSFPTNSGPYYTAAYATNSVGTVYGNTIPIGNIYYFDVNGSDSTGTANNSSLPFKTLTKLNSLLSGGTILSWDRIAFNTASSMYGEEFFGGVELSSSQAALTLNSYGGLEYKPIINPLTIITNKASTGWSGPDGNGVYSRSAASSLDIWEDRAVLNVASSSVCSDGNQFFSSGTLYYKPTYGAVTDHLIQSANSTSALHSGNYYSFSIDNIAMVGQGTKFSGNHPASLSFTNLLLTWGANIYVAYGLVGYHGSVTGFTVTGTTIDHANSFSLWLRNASGNYPYAGATNVNVSGNFFTNSNMYPNGSPWKPGSSPNYADMDIISAQNWGTATVANNELSGYVGLGYYSSALQVFNCSQTFGSITGFDTDGGAIKLTVSALDAGAATGDYACVYGVTGTNPPNGKWQITVDDSSHITLQGSTYATNNWSGGSCYGEIPFSPNYAIHNNYVHDVRNGYHLDSGANLPALDHKIAIWNEILARCPGIGIAITRPTLAGYGSVSNCTLKDCGTLSVAQTGFPGAAFYYNYGGNVATQNNIVSGACNLFAYDPGGSGNTYDYNDYYNASSGSVFQIGAPTKTFAQWQAAGNDTHSKTIDPQFINAGGSFALATDFKPKSFLVLHGGVNVGLTSDYGGRLYTAMTPPGIPMGAWATQLSEGALAGSSPMGLGLGMGLGGFPGWQHRPTQ